MPSELALLPEEITNDTAQNRLGFAILLKFFQAEGRFHQHAREVPKAITDFIAQQLSLSAGSVANLLRQQSRNLDTRYARGLKVHSREVSGLLG
ncbi:MAG: DUF4158 domain-containing protein [Cyanobacteria bacterium P01_H01_bin.15]